MTFEEIQKTLETMLEVQRELQGTQIKQSEEIKDLLLQGKEQDRRIQLILEHRFSIQNPVQFLDFEISQKAIFR